MGRLSGHRRRCYLSLFVLLMSSGLPSNAAVGADHTAPFKIGALTASWGPTPAEVGLRDGLVAAGYRENKQFVIGVRFTHGDIAVLPTAARELVENGADLIFTLGEYAAKAAQNATDRIPIVFTGVADPLRGLVQEFARPGGNITGVTSLGLDLAPKRLAVFQRIIPGLKRVLFVYDANDSYGAAEARRYRDAARLLGVELVVKTVQNEKEARTAIAQVRIGAVDGILKPRRLSLNIPGFILEIAAQRVPTMFDRPFWVERGGLVSYGPDLYESGRQAARLVEKILKGENPSEIPVETNSKIDFRINLKVAKSLKLEIPPEVLFQADKVIR